MIWLGVGVPWNGCCDAMTPSAPNRGMSAGCDRLDVLQPVTAAARRRGVHFRGVLDGVERHPDCAVADGVDQDLPAVLSSAPTRLVSASRREVRRARRRLVRVRREHRGGVRLDDAVGHELHRAGLEQRVVAVLLAGSRERPSSASVRRQV